MKVSRKHINLLAERIAEDGLVLMGGDSLEARNFSFYLTTPDEVPADQLVTEVCIPLT